MRWPPASNSECASSLFFAGGFRLRDACVGGAGDKLSHSSSLRFLFSGRSYDSNHITRHLPRGAWRHPLTEYRRARRRVSRTDASTRCVSAGLGGGSVPIAPADTCKTLQVGRERPPGASLVFGDTSLGI